MSERPSSPQAKEMADESMVRNLAAQAEAIWPQEEPILMRHPIAGARVLDLGCGTGEITARLAATFPQATFIGVDLEEPHLERARARCAAFGDRVRFEIADAMALPYDDATFDFVVCRHVLQAVPDAAKVLAEIKRVSASRRPCAPHRRRLRHAALPPDESRFRWLLAALPAANERRFRHATCTSAARPSRSSTTSA